MLVLSRRTSQQIIIGPEIRITVVRIDRNQVRLGIQAPPGLSILRSELVVDSESPSPSSDAGAVAVRTEIVPRRRSRPRREAAVAEPMESPSTARRISVPERSG